MTSAVAFAAHPDHENEDFATTGIVVVRVAEVELDSLDGVIFLSDKPTRDELVSALVVERSVARSSTLVQHVYGLSTEVVQYLRASPVSLLREDAALLEFAIASANAVAPRRPREDRSAAILAENRLLRGALGLPLEGTVTPVGAAAAVNNLLASRPQTVPAATARSTTLHASGASLVAGLPKKASQTVASASRSLSPGVLNDDAEGKPPIHSPLQWDAETEAAINARTVYRAYTDFAGHPARLDKVTQSHLIARLHDKSVDLKQQHRAQAEDQVSRSLGPQERRVLSADEEHELGVRLHDQQREYSKKVMTKLNEKYLPEIPRRALTPDVQKASAARMHDETMARAKKNLDALVDQYVHSRMPEKKKLDPDSQKAMAERLSATK
jgi:hypothetical protein